MGLNRPILAKLDWPALLGRAIVALIERELLSALHDNLGDYTPLFAERAEQEFAMRQEQVARREQKAAAVEERLRQWEGCLRRWEGEVEAREVGREHGRSKRTMPVRIGPQVQARHGSPER